MPVSVKRMPERVLTHADVYSHTCSGKIDCFISNKNNFIYNLLLLTNAIEARIPGTHSILNIEKAVFKSFSIILRMQYLKGKK